MTMWMEHILIASGVSDSSRQLLRKWQSVKKKINIKKILDGGSKWTCQRKETLLDEIVEYQSTKCLYCHTLLQISEAPDLVLIQWQKFETQEESIKFCHQSRPCVKTKTAKKNWINFSINIRYQGDLSDFSGQKGPIFTFGLSPKKIWINPLGEKITFIQKTQFFTHRTKLLFLNRFFNDFFWFMWYLKLKF